VPIPAVPSINNVSESPAIADWSTDASFVNASSRPTNVALVNVAGIPAFYGRAGGRSARLRWTA